MEEPKYKAGMEIVYKLTHGGKGNGVIREVEYSKWAKQYFYRVAFSEGIDYVWEDNIIVRT